MIDPIVTEALLGAVISQILERSLQGLSSARSWLTKGKSLRKSGEQYDRRLRETCDTMRVLSMREPVLLTNIYTRVNILEKITAYDWKNLEELEKSFDKAKRSFGVIKEEAKPGIQVANELPKFILLGKPGSGKTTFLKYVALQALDGKLHEELIPIFISLKRFADSRESLMYFIAKEFTICEFPEPLPYVQQILNSGSCILLLDGLDEVSKAKNESVVREIKELCGEYRDNHIIISCRIAAYNHCFQDFTDVELADFTDDQIQSFINKWFGEDSEKAELCWSQLDSNQPIKELASNPLLLTLFCIAFNKNMDLPKNRAELYQDAVDALLREWDGSRSIKRDEIYRDLSARRKEIMFSRIAYDTFEKDQFFLPHRVLEKHIIRFIENLPEADQKMLEPDSKIILKAIEAQHGIFVERAKGIYSFSHLTLQEFFAAKCIVENAPKGSLQTLVENHFTDDKWREVFLIATGMLGEADDFILMMKQKINTFLRHEKLAKFLKSVHSAVVRGDEPYNPALIAYDLVTVLDRARELVRARASAFLDSAFERAIFASDLLASDRTRNFDHAFNRALALALNFNLNLLEQITAYLQANKLLVDCLNTECYISRATRQKVWSELLTVP